MTLAKRLLANLDELPDLTTEQIQNALNRPLDFAYFGGNNEMFDSWALGPVIEHRDSHTLDRSNAKALLNALDTVPAFEGKWETAEMNHWAVGWVKHLSYQVKDENGKATMVARFIRAWLYELEHTYPVADEDLLSEMEMEEAEEAWKAYSLRDRIELCARFEVSIFAARRPYPPSDDQGGIQETLLGK